MSMRIGELARRTGVGVSTLRAWESRFHFLEPQRSPSGHRLYSEADIERVEAVLRLVSEGLTLPAAVARVSSVGTGALPSGEGEALLFRQILQVANHGIWVSRDGRTRYANPKMAELMGCSVDELLTRSVLDFHRPEELEADKTRGRRVRARERLNFTQELRRADGSTFIAQVTTTPLISQAGQYEGSVALVDDVTARIQTESEARFRTALLDAVGEAVLAARPDGTILYVNPAAEQLFGWRAAELIGQNGLEMLPTPDEASDARQMHSRLLAKERQVREVSMTRRDGTRLPVHVTGGPVLDSHGLLVGLIGVLTDSSDRNRIEQERVMNEVQAETVALLGERALRNESKDMDRILTEVVEAVRRVLDTERAGVMEIAAGRDELVVRVRSPHVDESASIPWGSQSLPGYTVLAGKVVVLEDAKRERRFGPSRGYEQLEIVSAIAAPVFGPSGVIGVLATADARPHKFGASAHFMQSMANVVGIALQRAP